MSTSACLMSWEPATRSAPSSTSTATGGAGDLGHEERLQVEVAGELLVEAPLGVPAVDQALGQGPPGVGLLGAAGRLQRGARRPRRRFQRAITFVYALSSTTSWYSSGPITP